MLVVVRATETEAIDQVDEKRDLGRCRWKLKPICLVVLEVCLCARLTRLVLRSRFIFVSGNLGSGLDAWNVVGVPSIYFYVCVHAHLIDFSSILFSFSFSSSGQSV